jgi:bidirectional [NiFe] hydrogenase diaphorase subunit
LPTAKLSVRIDGELLQVSEGQTVLEAARMAGRPIPTLCHFDGLKDVGACRLCVVEVSGSGKLLPACTTPVQESMAVTTDSPKLTAYRRMILELLFAERNHICSVCVSNGHCELQSLASLHGINSIRFRYRYPALPIDLSHDRYLLDHNRCIVCTRCVRVCADVEGAHVWDVMGRGVESRLICDLDQPWGSSSNCTNCGKCVNVCPTGALAMKDCAVEEMVKHSEQVVQVARRRSHI